MSTQFAETSDALQAVAKLHHPVQLPVMQVACHQEDCEHEDSAECEAACVPTTCCAHCTGLREEVATHEETDYVVEPWPCPTAKALGRAAWGYLVQPESDGNREGS